MVDLICALLVLLFGYLGWRRGFVLSVLPLLGLATGYLAAYLFYRPVGEVVGSLFDLQPLLAYPIGGVVAFVLAVLLFNLLGLMFRRWRRRRRLIKPRRRWVKIADRTGGLMLGSAYGGAFVLMAAWALLSLQALMAESHPDGFGPPIRETWVGRLALPFAEGVARKLAGGQTGDPTVARAAAGLARDPLRTSRDLAGVLSDKRVQRVLRDDRLMRQLARDPHGAANAPQLKALARDRDLVDRLKRLGLLQSAEVGDLPPREIANQLTKRLRPTARLVDQLSRDKEVQALLADPELMSRLEQRDLLALANDPKFNRLVEIITARMRTISAEQPE